MELIKINQSNGKQAVSARELHTFLEIETRFYDWVKRMCDYGFVDGVDYSKMSIDNQQVDYVLTVSTAKHWSMMQRTPLGMKARQYFIDVEEKQSKMLAVPNFSNPAEAARAWADEYEAKQIAIAKVKELEPKAEIYDSICTGQNLLSMGEAAKICGIGRNKLFALLRNNNVCMKNNTPYQQYIDSGYFEVKVNNIELIDTNIPTTYVTAKGLVWLKKQIQIWQK